MAGRNALGRVVFNFGIILFSLVFCCAGQENRARYDNYRLYRVELETDRHVQVFQDLEAKSDSHTFYGHARQPGQHLTIMVAANKVADFEDLMDRFLVKGRVLVND